MNGPLPVMVFIPGGRFEQGAAGTWIYYADLWVNKTNIIVVTINYRLGALGFLGSTVIPGNYGVEDQRQALRWVQQNIAAFGGNPGQVTLFGQSAGGTSTAVHLTSKASAGLFQKAIIHSNPFTLPLHDPISAGEISKTFSTLLGCPENDLKCMRNKTTDQIIKASDLTNDHLNLSDPITMFYPWTPMIDGVSVDAQPLYAFASGNFTKVPIMVGNVEEEALLFIWETLPNPATKDEYVAALDAVYGRINAQRVLSMYPFSAYTTTDYRWIMQQLGTDWIFDCPNRYIAAGIAKYAPSLPLYVYRFNHALSFNGWGPNYTFCVGHVCHASELVYLFQTASVDNSGFEFTAQEQQMADYFGAIWSNFARYNNPNFPTGDYKDPADPMTYDTIVDVPWPQWTAANDQRITIETPTNNLVINWRQKYCDFWDTLDYLNPKNP
jgi:acetylcholinesterase/cholinesterase